MEWLGDWLKQIILIILLAAFVDLLLPSQAMQRYVRTVVSLFLLLTLLTPIFELFQRDWDADKLLAEAQQQQTGGSLAATSRGGTALQSLEAILADSEKLQAENVQAAKGIAEAQLAEEMKAGLEKTVEAVVADIQVSIDIDQTGEPVIQSVRVVLSHKEEEAARPAAGQTGSGGVEPVRVEAVKPVTVAVNPAASVPPEEVPSAAEVQFEEQRSLCFSYMEKEWQVPRERLAVSFVSA